MSGVPAYLGGIDGVAQFAVVVQNDQPGSGVPAFLGRVEEVAHYAVQKGFEGVEMVGVVLLGGVEVVHFGSVSLGRTETVQIVVFERDGVVDLP